MSDFTKVYPTWQQKLRTAQEAEEKRMEVVMAADREVEAQQRRLMAGNLAFVLRMLGIEAEPVDNRWVKDGFVFWLNRKGTDWGPLRYENNGTHISFTLFVSKERPDSWDAEDDWIMCDELTVKNHHHDGDWSVEQAHLANSLDVVDERADLMLEAFQRHMANAETRESSARREPSIEEMLRRIVREVLLDEMARQAY